MKNLQQSIMLTDNLGKNNKNIEDPELANLFSNYYGELAQFLGGLPKEWRIEEFIGSTCTIYNTRKSFGVTETAEIFTEETEHQIKEQLTTRFIDNLDTSLFIYNMELFSKDLRKQEQKSKLNKILSLIYNKRAFNEGIIRNPYIKRILVYLEFKIKHLLLEIHEEYSNSKITHSFLTKKKIVKKNNIDTWTLLDIWMLNYDESVRELNYKEVIDYLLKSNFIIIEDDKYIWKFFPGKTGNTMIATFLVMCNKRRFIDLTSYSASELDRIMKNTFNDSYKTSDAYQEGNRDRKSENYIDHFLSMPMIKKHISL